jgi:hypothetical protein
MRHLLGHSDKMFYFIIFCSRAQGKNNKFTNDDEKLRRGARCDKFHRAGVLQCRYQSDVEKRGGTA